jgi:Protein of unknown function (DUF2891)
VTINDLDNMLPYKKDLLRMFLSSMTPEQAHAFAALALDGLQREYPNKIAHLLNGPADILAPRDLHPAFFGCWDVHSAIHSHWLVARVLRLFPNLALAPTIRRVLNENLTTANIQVEMAYFRALNRMAFERPYGWAWILKLQAEILAFSPNDSDARNWESVLCPLTEYIVDRFKEYLHTMEYINRSG